MPSDVSLDERYPDLAKMNQAELMRERTALIGNAQTYEELDDPRLQRLSAVLAYLRKGTSGPPKEAKKTPTLDSIL